MKMINIEAYIQPTNLTNLTQSNLICHSKLRFFFSWVNRLCKDTILLRPNNVVGLAHERSLTIWFVESGLEKLGFGHGAMFRSGFERDSCRERSWVWMFKPYGSVFHEIRLLGLGPRTIEVFPGSPTAGFFYDLPVLLGYFRPWSTLFSPVGSPPRFTYFFFYTSAQSLSFVHV